MMKNRFVPKLNEVGVTFVFITNASATAFLVTVLDIWIGAFS